MGNFLHPVIYSASAARNGLTQIAANGDAGIVALDGAATAGYTVPAYARYLMASWCAGASAKRAQLRSGTLGAAFARTQGHDIRPVRVNAIPLTAAVEPIPPQMTPSYNTAFALSPDESLIAFEDNGNNAEEGSVVAWLSESPSWPAPSNLPFVTVRCTTGTAAGVRAWTQTPLVFEDVLPAGMYALGGIRMQSPTGIAWRVPPIGMGPNPNNLRTGWLCAGNGPGVAFADHPFRFGNTGLLSRFTPKTPPVPEVFCVAADAAANIEFLLDVAKIG